MEAAPAVAVAKADDRRLLRAIRARRRALDFTQAEFAAAIGQSLGFVCGAELRKTDDQMTLGYYQKCAEVLRLDCRLELTLKKP